jgi:hypothetical protein
LSITAHNSHVEIRTPAVSRIPSSPPKYSEETPNPTNMPYCPHSTKYSKEDQDLMSNLQADLFDAFGSDDAWDHAQTHTAAPSWPSASIPSSISATTTHSLHREEHPQEALLPKPKRALTAYNLFFRHQRHVLLDSLPVRETGKPKRAHGKIGFADMGRLIGSQWKALDETQRAPFAERAAADKERYRRETTAYKRQQKKLQHERANKVVVTSPSSIAAPPPMSAPMNDVISANFQSLTGQIEPLPLAEEDPHRLATLASQLDEKALVFFIRAFR